MKKNYEKPVLVRHAKLAKVTAGGGMVIVSNNIQE
jgi:hypothetical protein